MKKRSLFAAVAMLIVSALVLTSATYAWFANGTAAQVNKIAASAKGSSGLVKVCHTNSATYSDWKQQLAYTDLGLTAASFDTEPIDVSVGTTPTTYSCAYTGDTFTAADTSSAAFAGVYYDFYVKAFQVSDSGKIDCRLSWDQGSNQAFVYGLVVVDGTNTYLFGSENNNETYIPFSNPGTAAESNQNGIVDAADLAADSASTITLSASQASLTGNALTTVDSAKQILLDGATTAHHIEVYLWAEGQDPQCVNANQNLSAGLTFSSFDYVAPAGA
jgi:hypothetical protein